MSLGYLARRVGQLLLVVWVAITLNFLIPRAIPGDPVEDALQEQIAVTGSYDVDVVAVADSYREKYGLDRPLWVQYGNYLADLVRGELGVSLRDFPQPVWSKIAAALPWTLGLLTVATLVAFAAGTLIGALVAWTRRVRALSLVMPPLVMLSAVPPFLIGILLVTVFAVSWPVLPASGGFQATRILAFNLPTALDIAQHSVLPALALVLSGAGLWALQMRGMMVTVLGEDYITFAQAKGLSGARIFFRYGLRNALLPQVTQLAIALGTVVSGAVLVEAIFNYPGLGSLLFTAIAGKDYFVIQGIVLMLIITVAVALFTMDLLYTAIDPRVRHSQ